MAAYYHGGAGTDIQSGTDGLQTLYLMNPSYAGYSEAAAAAGGPGAANMMLLNSAVTSMTPVSFGHQQSPSSAQHFVGIPLQAQPSGYNLWNPATTCAADMSPPPPPPPHQHQHQQARVSAVLSLSSREAPPVTVAAVAPGDEGKYPGAASLQTTSQGQMVMSSKYLKAAQELLDEVVSVSKGVDDAKAAAAKSAASVKKKEDSEGASGFGTEDGGGTKSGGAAPEISTAERQELQMKKGKLINMLDEVEQRYRQYHQQMQVVVSSFEAVAGGGSARTYTALALRTISRQFRCLRDAIAAQVRAASRALGEDVYADGGGAGGGRSVGSRLRYIDHQLRQQRALQQLGMMQSSAWRPQRGLPERSVSILRAWLFEHFLHPYPKDSDKIMLAKQTGLTRSQVSNWFINARVRLWKPMVEEMYLEETKDQDGGAAAAAGGDEGKSGGSKSGNVGVNGVVDSIPKMDSKQARMVGMTESGGGVHASLLELASDHQAHAGFYDDDEEEDGGGAASLQQKLKRARTEEQPPAFHVSDVATLHAQAAAAAAARHDEVSHRELLMKFMESGSAATGSRDHHHGGAGAGGYSLFAPSPYGQFGSEPFAFAGHGGGVSLTLGLPHGAEQTASFLMSSSNASDSAGHGVATANYDMNLQSTKSFAAQLMRDFVA
ncbi:hypothetical protein GUJ93_ZPchr0011g28336 [Zizania palustris]|uniref:Homeobox domain-containing protein n=1 Tax=Zizania palustris TaxID=103762 RepID=A0A8J5WHN1_ZIZPA|nr:hypothetical protein GUJ93_ZPchr0011g28336 [Zizania palustris]KAG8088986.1 hypothetical protein GUJ93_ZPchr0011g28336 [Zizania palustris]KAG8088987.1 hypothetical protein GUJ93_ZPchr0011g28336 [Zizania palustris]